MARRLRGSARSRRSGNEILDERASRRIEEIRLESDRDEMAVALDGYSRLDALGIVETELTSDHLAEDLSESKYVHESRLVVHLAEPLIEIVIGCETVSVSRHDADTAVRAWLFERLRRE